jgi:hypothetical protein
MASMSVRTSLFIAAQVFATDSVTFVTPSFIKLNVELISIATLPFVRDLIDRID